VNTFNLFPFFVSLRSSICEVNPEMDCKSILVVIGVVLAITGDSHGFSPSKIYPKPKRVLGQSFDPKDVGEPLILTPYLKQGKINEAQKLSRVTNLTNVESYSGYLTVNETYNSNMFFWFFPAQVSLLKTTRKFKTKTYLGFVMLSNLKRINRSRRMYTRAKPVSRPVRHSTFL
jgi:hypothetical protein